MRVAADSVHHSRHAPIRHRGHGPRLELAGSGAESSPRLCRLAVAGQGAPARCGRGNSPPRPSELHTRPACIADRSASSSRAILASLNSIASQAPYHDLHRPLSQLRPGLRERRPVFVTLRAGSHSTTTRRPARMSPGGLCPGVHGRVGCMPRRDAPRRNAPDAGPEGTRKWCPFGPCFRRVRAQSRRARRPSNRSSNARSRGSLARAKVAIASIGGRAVSSCPLRAHGRSRPASLSKRAGRTLDTRLPCAPTPRAFSVHTGPIGPKTAGFGHRRFVIGYRPQASRGSKPECWRRLRLRFGLPPSRRRIASLL